MRAGLKGKSQRTGRRHPGRRFADLYEGNAGFDAHHYRESGAPFVVLKASEGTGHVDAKHNLRARFAHEMGVPVGHYHFLRPGAVAVQARLLWTVASHAWHPRDFLIIDAEREGIGDLPDPAQLVADFDRAVHQITGRLAIGYSEDSFLHEHGLSVLSRKWWVADYGAQPHQPPHGQELWAHQYTDAGVIGGCVAPTDLSVLVSPSAVRYWDA